MAVDIQKLFNEDVPAKINGNPDAAKAIGATYQFIITGEGGGEWFINVKDEPKCVAGNPGGAECTMKLAAEDFQKLMENPQANGMQLFFSGKLKVEGNNMLAMKLQKLFAL
ncbi:MAG TPA: SCP2 sterol-binding domain-containing protein [Polyangium sp.]|nr:SCP2 sterol-binding domain-containing protein [Polyangium sp.]